MRKELSQTGRRRERNRGKRKSVGVRVCKRNEGKSYISEVEKGEEREESKGRGREREGKRRKRKSTRGNAGRSQERKEKK